MVEKFASLTPNELNAFIGIYVMNPETIESYQRKALSIIIEAITVDPEDPAYNHVCNMPQEGLVGSKMWANILEDYDRATIHDVRKAEERLIKVADTFNGELHEKKQQITQKYREYEQIYKRCPGHRNRLVTPYDVALRLAAAMSNFGHGAWGYHGARMFTKLENGEFRHGKELISLWKESEQISNIMGSSPAANAADTPGKGQTGNQKGGLSKPSACAAITSSEEAGASQTNPKKPEFTVEQLVTITERLQEVMKQLTESKLTGGLGTCSKSDQCSAKVGEPDNGQSSYQNRVNGPRQRHEFSQEAGARSRMSIEGPNGGSLGQGRNSGGNPWRSTGVRDDRRRANGGTSSEREGTGGMMDWRNRTRDSQPSDRPSGNVRLDNEAQQGTPVTAQAQNVHPARGRSNVHFAGGAVANDLEISGLDCRATAESDLEHDGGSIDDYDCEIPNRESECDDAHMVIEIEEESLKECCEKAVAVHEQSPILDRELAGTILYRSIQSNPELMIELGPSVTVGKAVGMILAACSEGVLEPSERPFVLSRPKGEMHLACNEESVPVVITLKDSKVIGEMLQLTRLAIEVHKSTEHIGPNTFLVSDAESTSSICSTASSYLDASDRCSKISSEANYVCVARPDCTDVQSLWSDYEGSGAFFANGLNEQLFSALPDCDLFQRDLNVEMIVANHEEDSTGVHTGEDVDQTDAGGGAVDMTQLRRLISKNSWNSLLPIVAQLEMQESMFSDSLRSELLRMCHESQDLLTMLLQPFQASRCAELVQIGREGNCQFLAIVQGSVHKREDDLRMVVLMAAMNEPNTMITPTQSVSDLILADYNRNVQQQDDRAAFMEEFCDARDQRQWGGDSTALILAYHTKQHILVYGQGQNSGVPGASLKAVYPCYRSDALSVPIRLMHGTAPLDLDPWNLLPNMSICRGDTLGAHFNLLVDLSDDEFYQLARSPKTAGNLRLLMHGPEPPTPSRRPRPASQYDDAFDSYPISEAQKELPVAGVARQLHSDDSSSQSSSASAEHSESDGESHPNEDESTFPSAQEVDATLVLSQETVKTMEMPGTQVHASDAPRRPRPSYNPLVASESHNTSLDAPFSKEPEPVRASTSDAPRRPRPLYNPLAVSESLNASLDASLSKEPEPVRVSTSSGQQSDVLVDHSVLQQSFASLGGRLRSFEETLVTQSTLRDSVADLDARVCRLEPLFALQNDQLKKK